ncbi:3-oxo-tetronate kinase [Anaerococcus vaginalis]|uniref:3-oxo-tetronate kinase n=3 Tax=Anaerococcus vaginalis TaxID=33037 RepID=UPI002914DF7A|nr:3-oxo-tetronate kinase [Anaerococcus vaginalis]MDU5341522.1 four-carbon acid sugar kinase family protein [Anaerococcus vaginalis]
MSILLGVIADDFSGASDAASFFAENKIRTVLSNGVPDENDENLNNILNKDAVLVIALKIRSEKKDLALEKVDEAYEYLCNKNTEKIFYKYCSTFDSTSKGNIGPITDFLLEKMDQKYTILEPALPVNGRKIKDGKLYVDGLELHKSHMKDHPLNPMWDSRISELMKDQGKYKTINISRDLLNKGKEEITKIFESKKDEKEKFYLVPDYYEEGDDNLIIDAFGDLKLLTGGSGLNTAISKKIKREKDIDKFDLESKNNGKIIYIVGSCSKITLKQIDNFKFDKVKIDIDSLMKEPSAYIEKLLEEVDDKVMFYSSDDALTLDKLQKKYGQEKITENLEKVYESLTKEALDQDFKNFIIAGGETSGVATSTLGFKTYYIGESVAAGVPILMPVNDDKVRLVLKSGNFGKEDFFNKTYEMIVG